MKKLKQPPFVPDTFNFLGMMQRKSDDMWCCTYPEIDV